MAGFAATATTVGNPTARGPGPFPLVRQDLRGSPYLPGPSTSCTSQVNLAVRASALKLGREPGASAMQRPITFAAALVSVPPAATDPTPAERARPLTTQGRLQYAQSTFARRPTPAAWISPEGARTPRR